MKRPLHKKSARQLAKTSLPIGAKKLQSNGLRATRKVESTKRAPDITGRVTDADNRAVANAPIVLVQKLLHTRKKLGGGRTDGQGRYSIPLKHVKGKSPLSTERNLVLEVWPPKGSQLLREIPLSPQNVNGSPLDVSLVKVVPLIQGLRNRIAQAGGPKSGLIKQELHENLAALTGVEKRTLARYSKAVAWSKDLGVTADWTFALLSNGAVKDHRSLFASTPARLKSLTNRSVAKGEIKKIGKKEFERMVSQVQAKAVRAMSSEKLGDQDLSMGVLLRLASADEEHIARVARLWHQHGGNPARFWVSVARDTGLPKSLRSRMNEAAEFGFIANGDSRVAERLKAMPPVRALKDIARLPIETLTRELKKSLRSGGGNASKIAANVSARAKEAFPTTAFLSDVGEILGARVGKSVTEVLNALHNDPKFDLHNSSIESHLKRIKAFKALGENDRREVVETLKTRQRILRLGSGYEAGRALIAAGYGSAAQIVTDGKQVFLSKTGKQLGQEDAKAIYAQAEETYAKTALLLVKYSPGLNTLGTSTAPLIPLKWDESPNLKKLFADQSLCACERCRSITGVAAYLVDLLQFLRNADNNAPNQANALDVLTRIGYGRARTRRPDLTRIELSCKNTNTEIPYLDIVLEVLEIAVTSPNTVTSHQTVASAEEIAGSSEYFNRDAYNQVARAVFPLTLPFDIYYEELKLILAELGTSRLELMETFADLARMPNPDTEREYLNRTCENVWNSEQAAGEVFGLSAAERKVISGKPLQPGLSMPVARFWGFDFRHNNWPSLLAKLSTFMQRSGLKYLEVLQLLALKALHAGHPLSLASDDPTKCDPDLMILQGLDGVAAGRLHRFIRLYRRTGWSMRDLDRALKALADSDGVQFSLNASFLIRLSHVQRLCARFNAPVPEILSWWSDMDTEKYNAEHLPLVRTHYQEVFERDMSSLVGNARLTLTEVQDPAAGPVSDKTAEIAGALRLSLADVNLLVAKLNLGAQKISLANLTLLYRHTTLASRMGLEIPEYLKYRTLAGDPFLNDANSPSTLRTLAFLDRWDSFRASNIPLDQINYFIGGVDSSEQPNAADAQKLAELRDRVRSRLEGWPKLPKLALQSATNGGTTIVTFSSPHGIESGQGLGAFWEGGSGNWSGLNGYHDITSVIDTTRVRVDVDSSNWGPPNGEITLVVDTPGRDVAIVQYFAEHFRIEHSIAEPMLRSWLKLADGTPYLIRLLAPDDPLADFDFAEIYRHVHAVAWFLSLVGPLSSSEAGWMFMQAPGAGFPDPTQWPFTPADDAARRAYFLSWRRWENWLALRESLPQSKREELVTLFALGSVSQTENTASTERAIYQERLAAMTGWDASDIRDLIGAFDPTTGHRMSTLNTEFGYHFRDEQLPFRLLRCFQLATRLGLSVRELSPDALLFRETAPQPMPLVNVARAALRIKVGESGWPAAAERIRNAMREKQRRALVDHLVAKWDLKDSGALYDHFLLDVEMSSCQKTTRIHAATHAVQLFTDRCLMNLEPDVTLTPEAAEQWDWMRRYPIWEANRKIFLYPENYLRPEFRDDRTPFFREFEDELKQNDITNATAEEALLHYLEKVDQVSRLQICGIYVERSEYAKDYIPPRVVHVFGRTRNSPHVYYYRKWLDGLRWTPWERVDANIEGDHLIPVVYFGRVYLFWPIINEKDGGPFNMDAFLRPIFDMLNFLMQIVRTGGAAVHAVIGAYNEMVEAIEQGVEELLKFPLPTDELKHAVDRGIDLDWLKITSQSLSSLPADPLREAINAVSAGLKLVFNYMARAELLFVLDNLPKKEYSIQLAWSELRNGKWTANKLSDTRLTFTDLTGPLMRQMQKVLTEASYPQAEERSSADEGFDRKRLFTFNAHFEVDRLVIQTHVTRLGIDLTEGDIDGSYLKFLGDFYFDDVHGSLTARRPPVGSFDYAIDLLADLQELAVGALEGALQFVSGEPVTQDDDPQGELKLNVIPSLLNGVGPAEFRLQAPHQYQKRWKHDTGLSGDFDPNTYTRADRRLDDQFFLQDSLRTFWYWNGTFQSHFHPFIGTLIRQLNRYGFSAPGLMDPNHQVLERHADFGSYGPTAAVRAPHPVIDIDYESTGAYAVYNWELFIHAPLVIAERLKTQHRHAEAERWLHFVFDPTDRRDLPSPSKYWRPRKFAETTSATYHQQNIKRLMQDLAGEGSSVVRRELEAQVYEWRHDPFNPFALARLRTTAFQRGVVQLYVKNLIAWGDQLFREETMTSVMAAALLFRRAEQLLGPRPAEIFARKEPFTKTYEQLRDDLDAFSNALVELEHLGIPWFNSLAAARSDQSSARLAHFTNRRGQGGKKNPAPVDILGPKGKWRTLLNTGWLKHLTSHKDLYFCIPRNDKLLELWDLVEDRLGKIRHCQDIEGRELALTPDERSIDPELLIRARQMGLDIGDLLTQARLAVPHYRFTVMVQRAIDLCNDVKALGSMFLGALEKKDAEEFAQLKQEQEQVILDAVRGAKQLALQEAQTGLDTALKAREMAELRRNFYAANLALPVSPLEITQLALFGTSIGLQLVEAAIMGVASGLSLVPDVLAGFPIAATETGGSSASSASERAAKALGSAASIANAAGSMVGIMAGYERRAQEWELQRNIAEKEIKQADAQILGAEIRVQMAQTDLENHDLQRAQSRRNAEFLQSKFTSMELYDYMVQELAVLHSDAYQLAFDLSRQAENAFHLELCEPLDTQPRLINSGQWDSLRKGLMAGEKLYADLKRMEMRYLERNQRTFEMTKQISLRQFFPLDLIKLKQSGTCTIDLPEWLFDMDYPGHYQRRIKSVAISIPCVVGPYASVNCTLRLIKNRVRISDDLAPGYRRTVGSNDSRFYEGFGGDEAIVTSQGRSDSGLFQLDLHDERYLPFEGAGVESTWSIEMPRATNFFDMETVSDVILHISYTAVEGSAAFKSAAFIDVQGTLPNEGQLLLGFRHEFPGEWNQFFSVPSDGSDQTLRFSLKSERFPFYAQGKTISINKIDLLAEVDASITELLSEVEPPRRSASTIDPGLKADPNTWGALVHEELALSGTGSFLGDWTVKLWGRGQDKRSLTSTLLKSMVWIIHYKCS